VVELTRLQVFSLGKRQEGRTYLSQQKI